MKKLAAIPSGGGWRMHGRSRVPRRRVGYRYIHTALDDRSRPAYSESSGDFDAAAFSNVVRRLRAVIAALGEQQRHDLALLRRLEAAAVAVEASARVRLSETDRSG